MLLLLILQAFTLTSKADVDKIEKKPQTQLEHQILFRGKTKNEVIIFIDLNTNRMERDAVRVAAEKNGKGMALIPAQSTVDVLTPITETFLHYDDALGEDELCKNDLSKCKTAHKRDLAMHWQHYRTLGLKVADDHPFDVAKEIEQLTTELQSEGLTVREFVISGHHGGQEFNGDFIVRDAMQEADVAAKVTAAPLVYDNLNLLGLWGCDSLTPDDAIFLASMFPSVRVTAGFLGTAPLGIREASWGYLTDIILNYPKLMEAGSPVILEHDIENIKFVTSTWSGLSARLDNGKYYFYGRDKGLKAPIFEELGSQKHCKDFLRDDYQTFVNTVQKYFDGKALIPIDTSKGELRDAFYGLTENRGCYADPEHQKSHPPSPNTAGLLRFYADVVENFFDVFSDELEAAAKVVDKASRPELKEFKRKFALLVTAVKSSKKTTKDKQNDIAAKELQRPELMKLVQEMGNSFPASADKDTADARKLYLLLHRYLVNLDEKCMQFLDWHDSNPTQDPDNLPTPHCDLVPVENTNDFTWNVPEPVTKYLREKF